MTDSKILQFMKKGLEHRYLPAVLAVAAFVIMLPALKAGFLADDFVQRTVLVEPSQLPEGLYQMGVDPDNPGRLSTALFDTFGFPRNRRIIRRFMNYGLLPWWTLPNLKASLWRPFTAFTHWLDYRLYPELPALMHAHNLLWFSAVVFVVSIFYRRLMGAGWAAGLAALLFLLDESTYFPVMFIANRGFIVSIFFAVLAILAHHRWRRNNSLVAAVTAQIFLLLSLLSNEAGVTTFAYLLAYALVLDESSQLRRALSLVPAVFVIVLWRVVYEALGYGVYGSGLYLDPVNEPLAYALNLFGRVPILLIGQFFCQAIDFLLAVNESIRTQALFLSVPFLVFVLIVFFPLLRRNRPARFWFGATIFSVIPIATVEIGSKNLAFVAVAAFGLISVFITALSNKDSWLPNRRIWRVPAYVICVIFLIVHIPMAAAGRLLTPKLTSFFTDMFSSPGGFGSSWPLGKKDVIVINAPSPLSLIFVPFNNAYYGKPVPKSLRALVPGFRPLVCTRVNETTVVLNSAGGNFFSCEQKSPLHFVYLFEHFNMFREKHFPFRVGDKVVLSMMTAEVVAVDKQGQPTEVSFSFDVPLEDPSLLWLWFDWQTGRYLPFEVPRIGQKIKIAGPAPVSFSESMKYIKNAVLKR